MSPASQHWAYKCVPPHRAFLHDNRVRVCFSAALVCDILIRWVFLYVFTLLGFIGPLVGHYLSVNIRVSNHRSSTFLK